MTNGSKDLFFLLKKSLMSLSIQFVVCANSVDPMHKIKATTINRLTDIISLKNYAKYSKLITIII